MADSGSRQVLQGRPVRNKAIRWDVREAKMQKQMQKQLRADVLDDAVKMYIEAEMKSNSDKQVAHNTIGSIVQKLGNPPWLTRDHIYNAVRKFRRQQLQQDERISTTNETQPAPPVSEITISPNSSRQISATSSLSMQTLLTNEESLAIHDDPSNKENEQPSRTSNCTSTTTSTRNKGGRPKGLTKQEAETRKKKFEEATEIASNLLMERRKRACIDGLDRLPNGTKNEILEEAVAAVGLSKEESKQLSFETIRSRVKRNNTKGYKGSYIHVSPMTSVEPVLAEMCRQLNRMGMSLSPGDFLQLANDLIEGSDIKEEVLKYREIVCGVQREDSELLGRRYFQSFMKRHSDILSTTRPKNTDLKRREWATYNNMEKMYNLCYNVMVEAGVANKLQEEVCFDRDGNVVDAESTEKFGLPSSFQLVHPDYVVFVDETGSSTNMKKDKVRGGSRVISEKGFHGGKDCIATDITYTTMGFTAATGEAVMCVVIFKSESKTGIRDAWVNGLDITKFDDTLAQLQGENFINAIRNNGQACGGGPKCFFRGKNVPCLVQHSPHGGVTGEILTNCLAVMDGLGLFPRTDTLKPFLLLDGHDSRFSLSFLQYIRDPINPWCCCFGVPYGTHFWQVGDSKQQNKSFKENESVFKEILMREKRKKGLKMVFKPTDVIPIVNYAWARSFARSDCNRKAILERGWNPCNYVLLTDPSILRTKVSDETDATTETNRSQEEQTQVPTLNTNTGMAAAVLDALYEQRDLDLYNKRKADRELAAETTARILDTTKQLTSGTAWSQGHNALHSDAIWNCKCVKLKEKEKKESETKNKKRAEFIKRKQTADIIRTKDPTTWKVSEIQHLLTYKRINGDPTIKSIVDGNKANSREALLREWDKRKGRDTPPCSPVAVAAEMIFLRQSDINDDEIGETESV